MVAPAPDAAELAKERDQAETAERLRLASGVAHLGTGAYDKAASAFCASGGTGTSGGANSASQQMIYFKNTMWRVADSGPRLGFNQFIPPGAHAVYATLTALASFTRGQVKSLVLENGDLRAAFEAEPWTREAARAVVNASYRQAWEGLIHNQVAHLLFYFYSVFKDLC